MLKSTLIPGSRRLADDKAFRSAFETRFVTYPLEYLPFIGNPEHGQFRVRTNQRTTKADHARMAGFVDGWTCRDDSTRGI